MLVLPPRCSAQDAAPDELTEEDRQQLRAASVSRRRSPLLPRVNSPDVFNHCSALLCHMPDSPAKHSVAF